MENRAKFSSVAAPVERPLPLWILYPLFFAILYSSHWTLLRLPFFWDEAGYYIPAALDFFRTGSLIPHSTVTNAHPPLPSVLLASWWRISGFNIADTRAFICMVAAAALLAVFRLARMLAGTPAAIAVTSLTAIYPVWFAQSTLAHADIFAAAFSLWALSFYFERFTDECGPSRLAWAAGLFSLAALSKETAIVTPVALGLWELVGWLSERKATSKRADLGWVVALFAPVLPLICWYLYHAHVTGFMFGNPEFLRYNATANLSLWRILISLWHRFVHLALHMNLYVPLVATAAALLMPRLLGRATRANTEPVLTALGVVIAGNAIAFSILGGALLTRYLLPLYPLEMLLCVAIWQERMRQWGWLVLLTGAAFAAGLWINPPYPIAPEDNLTYRDMVVLHQAAIRLIDRQFPGATVLSAWPATAEMEHPELGYTLKPLKTVSLENFTLNQIYQAAEEPGAYDTALVFSTKWTPSEGHLNLGHATESTDVRLYDFHRDLDPKDIAGLLHGDIVWQASRGGEWAAVLRFPRSLEANARH